MTDVLTRDPVAELADRFWAAFLESQPVYATAIGDERWSDRLPDPGPEGRERELRTLQDVLERSAAIDPSSLDVEDAITLDMLQVVARMGIGLHAQGLYELDVVNQLTGPQTLPGDLARMQAADTPERLDKLVARLAAYPRFMEATVGVMREAVASGRTAAPAVVERALTQTERIAATGPDASPLLQLAGLDDAGRERIRAALERDVQPALHRYLEALREYAPHARVGDGVWSIPDGDRAYRTLILAMTSLEEDAQALHLYGLEQLRTIDEERLAIAQRLGYDDIATFRARLHADPSNLAPDPAAIVRLAEDQVRRAEAESPRWFGRLPRVHCLVQPVPAFIETEAPGAFYQPPTADGSRPGVYFINTYDPASRPLHRLAAVTYHEATPGHHFQLTIETETAGLHPFRRLGSRLVGAAYPEGWGLYSERLADEMGLYLDDRERFGMLDTQAWRAARLVVDTGLHAFRWDRQRGIDFLVQTGLTLLEAETETDRYISWPGQALAYMVGMREIVELRRLLEERDGAAFDIKRFHDAVLGHGALPLATLRRELPKWVTPAG